MTMTPMEIFVFGFVAGATIASVVFVVLSAGFVLWLRRTGP